MTSDFQIKAYHWWCVISLAIVLHAIALLNYQQDHHGLAHHEADHQEIVISLKQLKAPQETKPQVVEAEPPVVQPRTIEPTPKPLPKKKTPVKKNVIKKPVTVANTTQLETPKVEPFTIPQATPNIVQSNTKKPNIPTSVKPSSSNEQEKLEREKLRYMTQLSSWLNKHKKYPAIARRRSLEGDLKIRFVIDRQGNLLTHEIIEPSIHKSLNTAAVKMLKRASPMPAVPASLQGTRTKFEYTIPLNFNLSNH